MEDWIQALRISGNREFYEPGIEHRAMMSGQHHWYACSHARPTYCNVCREALSGVTSHGLSCEVCKFKAHKRCAVRANSTCKWTTLAAVGKDIIEDEDGAISMPHQWLEGNLPVSAKCVVCDKTCGSVLRLQDWRCLWCKAMVHTSCRETYPKRCPLGQCRVSILPPIAINNIDSDGYWEAMRPPGTSPLLVFINSKSGDNQGVKFLRRFKQLLNPAQVFDLMNGGPKVGLRLFQNFDPFRILVCGGDGSMGWVLSEIDKMELHKQCQVGVLPLGTGNDLARVLGWGGALDDDTQLPAVLEKLEHSQIKMLDRWSIMTYEASMPPPRSLLMQADPISVYEDSVANHLSKILHSDDHGVVIHSAKVLCQTVKDFVATVGKAYDDHEEGEDSISNKCTILNEKLNSLLQTLNEEAAASESQSKHKKSQQSSHVTSHLTSHVTSDPSCDTEDPEHLEQDIVPEGITKPKNIKSAIFKPRDALMSRANSLKKAIRQIIEHTERAVDEQNEQTKVMEEKLAHLTITPPSPMHISDLAHLAADNRGRTSSTGSRTSQSQSMMNLSVPPKYSPAVSPKLSRSPGAAKKRIESSKSPSMASRRISSMSTFNRSASLGSNLCTRDRSPESSPLPLPTLGAPVFPMLPSLSSGIASSLAGGSFISKVLLANADALCAAASPLMEEEISLEEYTEKCVMNNYFGIGLDAKITLEFHIKREEHPEKCRSRTKNIMWYGVLGGKEILSKTFKNLEQRVQLECDGQRIPLPSLQGIVVLNIPSYMGGANFWGGTKEDDNFSAPSFDDKILEVVAVFGSMQMAVSKVINLQHHRIAQCRTVKVTIMGDEGVPVQVDGEAWVQPPGYIKFTHKNRAQMLTWSRSFESTLKSWSEKQKREEIIQESHFSPYLTEEETNILQTFVEATANVIRSVKIASICHSSVEQELYHLATQASGFLDRLYPAGKLAEPDRGISEAFQPTIRSQVSDLVSSVRLLCQETSLFLQEKATECRLRSDNAESLSSSVAAVEVELKRVVEIGGLAHFQALEEELQVPPEQHKTKTKTGMFRLFKKGGKSKEKPNLSIAPVLNVHEWGPEEVAQWLSSVGLGEYKDSFISHDIRGRELLTLERRDLKKQHTL
ncbi:diacylglycerol kinase delta isoform X2 [Lingula anatina]|uniref:Diacylglycerol kinase n=1 Tax=Lingula anatina TaxID=7574 RepID=A0A1S3JPV0_LINAN|nr:diacylglycerol kinase delta isoform X2 [Lingula anatina]|eukprot:XP_013412393.1 diacylglycerol kinase delta isoform X2 [Lingula anatina]